MPLSLVYIQKFAHLPEERGLELWQPLSQILVHGGLGDAKMFCGGAHRGFVFYNEHCQVAGALLDICIQMHHSPCFRSQCI